MRERTAYKIKLPPRPTISHTPKTLCRAQSSYGARDHPAGGGTGVLPMSEESGPSNKRAGSSLRSRCFGDARAKLLVQDRWLDLWDWLAAKVPTCRTPRQVGKPHLLQMPSGWASPPFQWPRFPHHG